MNRIKELRKKKGITAKELSEVLGISQSMLTNYENGSSTPREYSIWKKLSEYFDVSISYLMGLTDILGKSNGSITPDEVATFSIEHVEKEYIATGKPIEFQISSAEEYAVLLNISQIMNLGNEEANALLHAVQKLIREKYLGRCTEFRLPDEFDPI